MMPRRTRRAELWLRYPRRGTGRPIVVHLALPKDLRALFPDTRVRVDRTNDGRVGACASGKGRYGSERDALVALAGIVIARNAGKAREHMERRAYLCPSCGGWHLTSKPFRPPAPIDPPPGTVPRQRSVSGPVATTGERPASDRSTQ